MLFVKSGVPHAHAKKTPVIHRKYTFTAIHYLLPTRVIALQVMRTCVSSLFGVKLLSCSDGMKCTKVHV